MSLNDEYLKKQLSDFRDEIRSVFWIREESDPKDSELEKWIWKKRIHLIEIEDWNQFWNLLDENFKHELDTSDGWHSIISSAIHTINEAYEHEELIKGYREAIMMGEPDIEKVNDILLPFKATLLENGVRFSDSLKSQRIISKEEEDNLVREAFKQSKFYKEFQVEVNQAKSNSLKENNN